ncbi:MAG: hypothetical protein OHK0039_14350 [Bacteroidia bacterium]
MHKLVFFNNKGGVGKTTMVYHLSWMFAELGHKVLAVDLDPQSNLSSLFLDIDRLAETMEEDAGLNILDALTPIAEGEGYQGVHLESISEYIGLVVGNLALSLYEDKFSDAWLKCLDGDLHAFKVLSAFQTLIEDAAQRMGAEIVLIDVGPNLGAINRTCLISSDWVILAVDMELVFGEKVPFPYDPLPISGLRAAAPDPDAPADWARLYPNPATKHLQVQLAGDYLPAELVIRDMNGQTVSEVSLSSPSTKVDLS